MRLRFTTPLVLTMVVFAFPASHLQAQGDQSRRSGPPDAEMRVAHLTRTLELNDEQSARLLEVFQAVDEERHALREQAILQMKPQICELQLATIAEVRDILDASQWADLEIIRAKHNPKNARQEWRAMQDLDCSAYE